MKVGQKVRIVKPVRKWNRATSAYPQVGLVGVISDPNSYPWPEPPEGTTAVTFKARDLGYLPHDEDHETVCYYISTKCLEVVHDSVFGIFDYSMIPKIRRLLKPYGLQFKVKTRKEDDQVLVWIEPQGGGK
jgi:hypothetical protein